MSQGLDGVRKTAKERKQERFTAYLSRVYLLERIRFSAVLPGGHLESTRPTFTLNM